MPLPLLPPFPPLPLPPPLLLPTPMSPPFPPPPPRRAVAYGEVTTVEYGELAIVALAGRWTGEVLGMRRTWCVWYSVSNASASKSPSAPFWEPSSSTPPAHAPCRGPGHRPPPPEDFTKDRRKWRAAAADGDSMPLWGRRRGDVGGLLRMPCLSSVMALRMASVSELFGGETMTPYFPPPQNLSPEPDAGGGLSTSDSRRVFFGRAAAAAASSPTQRCALEKPAIRCRRSGVVNCYFVSTVGGGGVAPPTPYWRKPQPVTHAVYRSC